MIHRCRADATTLLIRRRLLSHAAIFAAEAIFIIDAILMSAITHYADLFRDYS